MRDAREHYLAKFFYSSCFIMLPLSGCKPIKSGESQIDPSQSGQFSTANWPQLLRRADGESQKGALSPQEIPYPRR
jgi:hypothetical protein